LLNLVYAAQPTSPHPSARGRLARDFTHHRR
jgi:hypothetical protein